MRLTALIAGMLSAVMLGVGRSPHGADLYDDDDDDIGRNRRGNGISRIIMEAVPKRPTFTSEQPLTKRQRRRLRGKAKP